MKDVQLVAADMDHTLLTEKGELPPNINQLITKLDELGVHFGIASGRPLYTLVNLFSEVSDQMIFISDNGGLISYQGEIIFKSLISNEDYKAMLHFVEKQTDGIAILCGLDSAYVDKKYEQYSNFLHTFYTNITFVDDMGILDLELNKFTIYFPNKDSKAHFDQTVGPQFSEQFSVTIGDTIWIDIMNRGIDKGKAMDILGDKMGIGAHQMMAFGDTYNDKEMLQHVEFSYLVANAQEDMKQYAKYTTASNDDYGVSKILEQLIEVKTKHQDI